jgi:predicted adenine nucleotide alpha hydrolase (AANH) superfamily ATPase
MLVHICCSVDSHFFLQNLQRDYPDEPLRGFFYDPNIHPYSEYQLRKLDVERSCQKLGIELLEGPYDVEAWLESVRGLENEPEKGKRCEVCFDNRLEVTAQKAVALGESKITTTLLVSPLKSQLQLQHSGKSIEREYGVSFLAVDYRANGGTQQQNSVSKEEQLYRQDYCGCLFGLSAQRQHQDKLMDEMFSPLANQVLPGSIEERLALYSTRMDMEASGQPYHIVKQKFLNYRQMACRLESAQHGVIPSHALTYSTLPRQRAQGSIHLIHEGIGYLNRDEIRLVSLERFNTLANTSYSSTLELIYHPPGLETELHVRQQLTAMAFDLTPILVVDTLPHGKITLFLEAKTYEDTKEQLISFR